MKVLVRVSSNPFKIAYALQNLSVKEAFKFYCIDGSIVKAKDQFKIVTDNVTILTSYVENGSATFVLFTNDKKYEEFSEETIDLNDISKPNINWQICQLLWSRYKQTGGDFSITFNGGDCGVVTVSPTSKHLSGCAKGADGDTLFSSDDIIRNSVLCKPNIRDFECTLINEDYTKTISVKGSFGEILKEISHYLGKTIVLASQLDDGRMLEQYISNAGSLEVYTKQDGTRFYKKVPSQQLVKTNPICVYLSSSTVAMIVKEQGRALSKPV